MDENRGLAVIPSSIFNGACYVWAALALVVVPYLLLRPAPYGRHSRTGWGPTLNARLAWVLMEAPSPILMSICFVIGRRPIGSVESVFLGLWLSHYLYRAFVFPLLLPASSRPMPVTIAASGGFFNLVNASLNGIWLFSLSPARPAAWLSSPAFIAGTTLFVAGYLAHLLADHHLRRLRLENGGGRGVPRGWLFQFLSCPNYFGEIVEWAGFAIATWSPCGLLFALWTAANLVPRAIHHHRWYRAKFADYPSQRRAVVPFVL
jgi:3-oxo-5-alpha-steroid 4-dehydrogenase 1